MKKSRLLLFLISLLISISLFGTGSAFAESYRYPLMAKNYSITSYYGYRIHPIYKTKRFHAGVDLVNSNKYILATKTGYVYQTGYDGGRGNYIVLHHNDDGHHSTYMHLAKIYVKKGQKIKQGQIIGYMGTTGASTGVHLHFQLNKAPSYSSTMEVNPTKRAYVYSTSHTHVYTSAKVDKNSPHPHKLVASCICGKTCTTTTASNSCALVKGCSKCYPKITTKSGVRSYGNQKTISWTKINNATQYRYYLYCVEKKYGADYYVRTGTTKSTSVTFKDLLPGDYRAYVVAEETKFNTKSSVSPQVKFYMDQSSYKPKAVTSKGNKIFAMYDVSTSWKYAENIAKRLGGHLATIDTKEKNSSIATMIKKYGKKRFYFIGGNDEAKKGTYKWLDGTSFRYKAFASGQPSHDYYSTSYIKENYLAIDKNKNCGWNDLSNYCASENKSSTADKGFIVMVNKPSAPNEPEITATQVGASTINLKWKAIKNANKYVIYSSNSKKGTYKKVAETEKTEHSFKGLKFKAIYYYKVKAVTTKLTYDVLGDYSNVSGLQISPTPTSVKLKNGSGKKITISYSKSTNANTYKIYRSTKPDSDYELIKKTTSLSYTDEVTKDRYYYYKVLPYYKKETVVIKAPISKPVCIKFIKKPGKATSLTLKRGSGNSVIIKYRKASDAVGYYIYRSTSKSSGYKKITTTKNLSYTDTSSKKKKTTYYYKIIAYNQKEDIIKNGDYSNVKYITIK